MRPYAPPLEAIAQRHGDRDRAVMAVYVTGACSYHQIADHFGLYLAIIGQIMRRGRLLGETCPRAVCCAYSAPI